MGIIVALVEVAFPHKISTIMELDYDTPYDRHIIIEESKDTKHKRPRLEEPIGTFGSKILRRLSKRQSHGPNHHSEDNGTKFGLDNPSMELDPPKSPWRYPHRTFSNQLQQNNQPMRPSSRSKSIRKHHHLGIVVVMVPLPAEVPQTLHRIMKRIKRLREWVMRPSYPSL